MGGYIAMEILAHSAIDRRTVKCALIWVTFYSVEQLASNIVISQYVLVCESLSQNGLTVRPVAGCF